MELKWLSLGLSMFVVSFCVSYGVFPTILRMAKMWGFYDNPDTRKLQREPVPVMGGAVVYFAILISSSVVLGFSYFPKLVYMLIAMGVMLALGMIDDKRKLSVSIRFAMEISVLSAIVLLNGNFINTFGGIWGIWHLNGMFAVPASVFAGVGIVNAINLMDGVDGYSSSYVFLAYTAFACIFFLSQIPLMAVLSMICAGSLLPFMLHNIFGKKTKMFIGDGGTMMMGMTLAMFSFSILKEDSYCYTFLQGDHGVGLIPLTLSILSISVFDTLRVMTTRILHGRSPFRPDNSHLHHLFIRAGYSHAGTALSLILLNFTVVAGWFVSWACGAGVDIQFYVVITLGFLNTFGLYSFMDCQSRNKGRLYDFFRAVGARTQWSGSHFWRWMQHLVDGELSEEEKI